MKLIGIVGMPGTGKTTLMRRWMETREWVEDTPMKLLNSHLNERNGIRVFGKYREGDVFAGTDKLSMAVQPVAIQYLQNPTHAVTVFEGDRLTSVKFFKEAERLGHDVSIVVLSVSDAVRERRYGERGSSQSESFIKGRRTKIQNIMSHFTVFEFNHETEEDTQDIIDFLETQIL
jgi:dephospho-CoA kinase